MTRFGVMRHLGVLEDAQLISTRKIGREKRHYLNPVPIRLIHDRWISKYAEPVVGTLSAIKDHLEGRAMSAPDHVYSVYIKADPERIWRAITDGVETEQYYYGTRVGSTWEPGARIVYEYPDGSVAADGEVIEADPPRRLAMTFHARWDPEIEAEGPVRMTWEIEPSEDGSAKLTVTTCGIGREDRGRVLRRHGLHRLGPEDLPRDGRADGGSERGLSASAGLADGPLAMAPGHRFRGYPIRGERNALRRYDAGSSSGTVRRAQSTECRVDTCAEPSKAMTLAIVASGRLNRTRDRPRIDDSAPSLPADPAREDLHDPDDVPLGIGEEGDRRLRGHLGERHQDAPAARPRRAGGPPQGCRSGRRT